MIYNLILNLIIKLLINKWATLTIDELEKIDNDIESSVKVGILNRSLPVGLMCFNLKMIGINAVNMLRMYCLK